MRKLTRDEVRELQDGQSVHVKLTRLARQAPELQYEGPATLYVQRHNGVIVTLAVNGVSDTEPLPVDWAEYDPRRDFEYDDSLVNEDYQLEVFEP